MPKPIAEMTPAEQSAYCKGRLQDVVDRFRAEGYSDQVIAMGMQAALYGYAAEQGFSAEAVDAMLERMIAGRAPS